MTLDSLLKLLDKRAKGAGNWAKLASTLGVSPQYLHDCKEGRRRPAKKLLDALNLVAVIDYRRKER
jgi:hypothetical protein